MSAPPSHARLRTLAEAAIAAEGRIQFGANEAFKHAANPQVVLGLLDTIASLEAKLRESGARERALIGERDAANRGRAEWFDKATRAEAKLREAEAREVVMVEALRKAAEQFNWYAQNHMRKDPPDREKAQVNASWSSKCFQAASCPSEAAAALLRRVEDLQQEVERWKSNWIAASATAERLRGELEAAQKNARSWQPIETAPKGNKLVVGWRNSLGKWRSVMSTYYLPRTLECDQVDNDSDDDGFAPEGWYEESETQDVIKPLDGSQSPTHWRPLPSPPEVRTASPPQAGEGKS